MPFYEYECASCKFYSEVMQKITDAPLTKCPSCGKSTLKKLVSAPNFRLKGGGWYETDFKSEQESRRNLAEAEKAPAEKPAEAADSAKPADKPVEAKPSEGKASEGKASATEAKRSRARAPAAAKSASRKSAPARRPVKAKAKAKPRPVRKARR